jgi:hypothetical protein
MEKGTFDASEFKAALTQAQGASASSFARFALRPDPSSPSSFFSSGKCDMAATNVDQPPSGLH